MPASSSTPAVPWRLRHALEQWVEAPVATQRHPGALPLAAFRPRRQPSCEPLTAGPAHHFFGYYDKSPWSAERPLAACRTRPASTTAPAGADDRIGIGVLAADGQGPRRFERLATGSAWNWQQGAMAHLVCARRRTRAALHLQRPRGRAASSAVLHEVERQRESVNSSARCTPACPTGAADSALNFARLAVHRPGYGYAGGTDAHADDPHPAGRWRLACGPGQRPQRARRAAGRRWPRLRPQALDGRRLALRQPHPALARRAAHRLLPHLAPRRQVAGRCASTPAAPTAAS
jgi:hypothetical protein